LLEIIDPEAVELSNLNRQVLYSEDDLGKPKAEVLVQRLSALRRPSAAATDNLTIKARTSRLDSTNIAGLFSSDTSLVIDACDCTKTKFLINDFCVSNAHAFCHAGVLGDYGQLLLVCPPSAAGASACLRCLFGNLTPADIEAQTTSCRTAGIFGAVAGYLGLRQGELAMEYLLNGDRTHVSKLIRFSLSDLDEHISAVRPAADCPLGCARHPYTVLDITPYECPATFLYTKLALERIKPGDTLDVRLSSQKSAEHVRRSVEEEGHAVFATEREISSNHWRILIEK
jgi:molybdopterin/thiamine biosynthesis adenylyltransferase